MSIIPPKPPRTKVPCPGDPGYDYAAMEARYAAKCQRDPQGCRVDLERIEDTIEQEMREGLS